MQITKHKVVKIHYTLTDDDGEVIDSSEGGEPLEYLHGVGGIIPGLERVLEGKKAGDQFKLHVEPEDAYGDHDEDLLHEVDRSQFEGIDDLELGMQFQVDTDDGPIVVTVIEITDETVTVDGNHELAGIPLNFEVTVGDVRDATKEEIEHGHAHGEGCHEH
ncbi:MAG: peptidylprolyl isomerase [Planctomycetaceae bacterium]|nr:peptidylprolyl isomerase [Planctomycetales bacterium]MCB9926603.1 peptidylprolyl isomerase [Planctomycetaceae bacterium]